MNYFSNGSLTDMVWSLGTFDMNRFQLGGRAPEGGECLREICSVLPAQEDSGGSAPRRIPGTDCRGGQIDLWDGIEQGSED